MGEGIPEWVFWLSTAVGTGLGAFIVRLGWKTGSTKEGAHPPKPEGTAYIDRVGVLVDNKTIELLAGSIEGATLEIIASRKTAQETDEHMIRAAKRVTDELEELRNELRELGRQLSRRDRG